MARRQADTNSRAAQATRHPGQGIGRAGSGLGAQGLIDKGRKGALLRQHPGPQGQRRQGIRGMLHGGHPQDLCTRCAVYSVATQGEHATALRHLRRHTDMGHRISSHSSSTRFYPPYKIRHLLGTINIDTFSSPSPTSRASSSSTRYPTTMSFLYVCSLAASTRSLGPRRRRANLSERTSNTTWHKYWKC